MQLWDLPPTFLLAVSWGLFPDSRVFLAYDFFCPSSQLAMMGQISLAHWSLTTNCVLLLLGIPLDPFNNPGYPPCFEVSWSAVSVHSICAVSFVKWLKYTGSRAEEDRYWVITLGTWSKEELELKVTKANVSAHQKQKNRTMVVKWSAWGNGRCLPWCPGVWQGFVFSATFLAVFPGPGWKPSPWDGEQWYVPREISAGRQLKLLAISSSSHSPTGNTSFCLTFLFFFPLINS